MSAVVSDQDREAARAALGEVRFAHRIINDRITATVAQAIAEAREQENRACEAIARERLELWKREFFRATVPLIATGHAQRGHEAEAIASIIARRGGAR